MARDWYPVIDYEKCTGCLKCLNFCPHGVYELGPDGKPRVAYPENCIELCHACAWICPNNAISFDGELAKRYYERFRRLRRKELTK